ncbi:MAG: copper chaperone PCu(A)C [Gammaproteobacteria bacterium]
MKRMLASVALIAVTTSAWAGGALEVSDAWIRHMPADIPSAGYFNLKNEGSSTRYLVGAECAAFGNTMLHRSVETNGVSRMLHVEAVKVAPGGEVKFAPGGYHVMFMMPKGSLKLGEQVPVTLKFRNGQQVTARFTVRSPASE